MAHNVRTRGQQKINDCPCEIDELVYCQIQMYTLMCRQEGIKIKYRLTLMKKNQKYTRLWQVHFSLLFLALQNSIN